MNMKTSYIKKIILLFLFASVANTGSAQFLPIQPIDNIPYYNGNLNNRSHTSVMIIDSSIYEIRELGIESCNIVTGATKYKWKNQYGANILVPDGNGNFMYSKQGNFIGKYNSSLHDYVNINTAPFNASTIHNMGLSPNHNLWALGNGKLGIYNGSTWQVYPFANTYGFFDMKVINDTSAYLCDYYHIIFKFHQGILDTLYTLPTGVYYQDSDVDTLGNLWIAGHSKIIKLHGSTATVYDSTNLSSGGTLFEKIVAGRNGHVWTCGTTNKMFEYDGSSWSSHQLAAYINIDNFNVDSLGNPWVIAGDHFEYNVNAHYHMYIYKWNGSSFNAPTSFPFMPYGDVKLISTGGEVEDESLFTFSQIGTYSTSFILQYYMWTNQNPYSDGINYYNSSPYIVGTNHGVYTISGVDTNALPSDTVNYVTSYNNSYYVCTDKGLLIYNGTFYYTMDMSNSPLPSNKITFATIEETYPYNKLYIGTDKGMAIYSNNNWTVFDSANTGENFNVTGILPPTPYSNDSTTFISTMGQGLIKSFPSGGYEIMNTANGRFQDDSLFYVVYANMGECEGAIMTGTKAHGIAFRSVGWWDTTTYYYNTSTGYPFNQSRSAVGNTYTYGTILIGTNKGIYYASPCGGIEELGRNETISIYPNPTTSDVTIKQAGNMNIKDVHIYSVLGECVLESVIKNARSEITMDVSGLAKGVYIIKCTGENGRPYTQKLMIQ